MRGRRDEIQAFKLLYRSRNSVYKEIRKSPLGAFSDHHPHNLMSVTSQKALQGHGLSKMSPTLSLYDKEKFHHIKKHPAISATAYGYGTAFASGCKVNYFLECYTKLESEIIDPFDVITGISVRTEAVVDCELESEICLLEREVCES